MILTSIAREVMSNGSSVLTYAGPGIAGGAYAIRGIQSVPDGFVGLRTRFKNPRLPHANNKNKLEITEDDLRNYVTHGSLPKFHWPLTHSIVLVSTQDRLANLATTIDVNEDSHPCLSQKRQLEVGGEVAWGVKADKVSAYRAMYMPSLNEKGLPDNANLVQLVEGELAGGFRHVMQGLTEDQRRSEEASTTVKEQMQQICKDGLERYGSEIRWVRLQKDARSVGHMILESRLAQTSPEVFGILPGTAPLYQT